jgi:flavin-dependent dehydrogenase
MATESYDVMVVGAGLAGLQCARLLAGHGLQVALVDRKASLDQAVHTTGIFVRRSLSDFAIPAAYLGPPIRHVAVYSPAGRRLELASDHDEFRIGRMGPLYLRMLKDCRAAGAEWLPNTSFVTCADELPTGMRVRLRSGGTERSVSTRYLVGADGTNSQVARRLGLSQNRSWLVGLEEVYEGVALDGPPTLHCFFDRRIAPGYIAWIAADGESVHVGVGGYPHRFQPAMALDRFRATAAKLVDLRKALVERRAGRIPVGGILPRIANTRGLLLGDAAGAVSPLTAGGLDPCLRLAELAASATYRFLSTGNASELGVYDGRPFRRKYLARRLLRGVYDLAGTNLLLEAGCAAMRTSYGRRIARRIFFGRGSFPDVRPAPANARGRVRTGAI